jgi:WD40 repeat protein
MCMTASAAESSAITNISAGQTATVASSLRLQSYGTALSGHTGAVRWGAWGRLTDRPVLATGGLDGTVRLWDPQTGPAG